MNRRKNISTILSPFLKGLAPRWLIRWNGLPGTVAISPLEGEILERSIKLLWAKDPKTTVAALVQTATGKGKILFLQLDIQRRLDHENKYYPPSAEKF